MKRTAWLPCLDGLLAQGPEVGEILIVDGGSTDGTRDLVRAYARRDRRLRLVEAGPAPDDWNGKVWGLDVGERALSSERGVAADARRGRAAVARTCPLARRARSNAATCDC